MKSGDGKHSLQIESQEEKEKKWKNFSQGIVWSTRGRSFCVEKTQERSAQKDRPRVFYPCVLVVLDRFIV